MGTPRDFMQALFHNPQLEYERQLAQAARDATQVTRHKTGGKREVFDARDECLNCDAQIEPGQMQTEAAMSAGGEAQVAIRRARDVSLAGI